MIRQPLRARKNGGTAQETAAAWSLPIYYRIIDHAHQPALLTGLTEWCSARSRWSAWLGSLHPARASPSGHPALWLKSDVPDTVGWGLETQVERRLPVTVG